MELSGTGRINRLTPTPIIDYEADQDLDGLPDYIEDQLGTDPLKADTDDDLLTDYIEVMIGYDPTNPDTDNNGIIDGNEDCDNDGLSNVYELSLGTNPVMEDTDGDHLIDGDEVNIYNTNPLVPDSDGDGIKDGDEVAIGKNPTDPSDGDVRILQTISRDIDNTDDPAVTSVDVSVSLANRIDRSLNIRDYYNVDVYSTDVYGRIGSPINFECDESFDSATVVIHYDETQLGSTEEDRLGVLWYDEANGVYIIQEQAIVDTSNNTITLELSHFSTYVVVDLDMWNNPILPDYSNYIMIAEGGTGYYAWHDGIPTLDEEEYECFVWWKLSHGGQYRIVDRIYGYAHTDADPSKIIQLWEYSYTWLVMDMTDSDEDGVLDFMESQGILGTNRHIYYADPTKADTDEDGLSDAEELGVTYIVSRAEDGSLRILLNKVVVYENDEGIIDPESQYYLLNNYFTRIGCGCSLSITVLRSDAEKIDSDGDLDNDFIDPKPTRRHLNDRLVYNISLLEDIANEYNPNLDYKQLVFSFIRSFWPNYFTALWDGTGGIIDDEFKNYISTYYPELYSYFETTSVYYADDSGNLGDFYHFAATMNGLIYESDYSSCTDDDYKLAFQLLPEGHIDNLAGWAGDYQQFVRDNVVDYVNIYCDYSSMYDYVYSQLFMGASESSFSMDDLYADVDALNVSLANDNETLSDTMRIYFDESINQRFTLFVDHADLNKLSDYSSVAYIVNIFGWTRWPLYRGYNVESLSSDQWNAIMDAFVDRLNYLSGIE